MKNMMKAMICTLTLIAAAAFLPAAASAKNNQEVYISKSNALVLRDMPRSDAAIILYAEGKRYELFVQDFQNGFGYCYTPAFGMNGWVDLADVYYDGPYDINGVMVYDGYSHTESLYDGFFQVRYSSVPGGSLALLSAPDGNDANIIATMSGCSTILLMTGDYTGNYGYAFVPVLNMYGWVDSSIPAEKDDGGRVLGWLQGLLKGGGCAQGRSWILNKQGKRAADSGTEGFAVCSLSFFPGRSGGGLTREGGGLPPFSRRALPWRWRLWLCGHGSLRCPEAQPFR